MSLGEHVRDVLKICVVSYTSNLSQMLGALVGHSVHMACMLVYERTQLMSRKCSFSLAQYSLRCHLSAVTSLLLIVEMTPLLINALLIAR